MIRRKLRTFVVTGGGTGGHIYPALAIARGLDERFPGSTVHYVGGRRGLETSIVPRAGLPLTQVHCRGMERRIGWKALAALGETSWGLAESLWILRRLRPDMVIGTGGFVALPVVLAATWLGIPAVIHEQNAYPGVTNRLLAPRVRSVMLTFDDAATRIKAQRTIVTGLPVRPEIFTADCAEGRRFFGLPSTGTVLLAVGGSRGAQQLNEAMPTLARAIEGNPEVSLLHVTGEAHFEPVRQMYAAAGVKLTDDGRIRLLPYLDRMDQALAASDLCIGRAGAAFLSEITLKGLPSILVPYPHAAENHQEANARSLVGVGAARMILDRDLTSDGLAQEVTWLLARPDVMDEMRQAAHKAAKPQALSMILEEIERLVLGR